MAVGGHRRVVIEPRLYLSVDLALQVLQVSHHGAGEVIETRLRMCRRRGEAYVGAYVQLSRGTVVLDIAATALLFAGAASEAEVTIDIGLGLASGLVIAYLHPQLVLHRVAADGVVDLQSVGVALHLNGDSTLTVSVQRVTDLHDDITCGRPVGRRSLSRRSHVQEALHVIGDGPLLALCVDICLSLHIIDVPEIHIVVYAVVAHGGDLLAADACHTAVVDGVRGVAAVAAVGVGLVLYLVQRLAQCQVVDMPPVTCLHRAVVAVLIAAELHHCGLLLVGQRALYQAALAPCHHGREQRTAVKQPRGVDARITQYILTGIEVLHEEDSAACTREDHVSSGIGPDTCLQLVDGKLPSSHQVVDDQFGASLCILQQEARVKHSVTGILR